MNEIDRKILRSLQEDSSRSLAEIAELAGLSPTPCWRRIQNLEKAGVITGRVALLDAEKLNVGTTVFVRIKT
ncbi:MAG: winged helix-turn-helix transcriptional regulator, partial [Alphaproteobacteria bacterium]|nr:winged helix-turn-helix transcriptional regulator [Alphaproteobacteria bacterium]